MDRKSSCGRSFCEGPSGTWVSRSLVVDLGQQTVSATETGPNTPLQINNAGFLASQAGPAKLLPPVDIVPDFNRDGIIDDQDRGKVTETEPWRSWLNDDTQWTTGGDDIPLASTSGSFDWNNDNVDGMRDLVDWFPLFFDIKQLIEVLPPSSGATYKLKQEDGALNVIFTDLAPGNVRDFLTKLDATGGKIDNAIALSSAQRRHVTSAGVAVEESWLTKIRTTARAWSCWKVAERPI